ncbi:histidine kinase dimerization/phosphoacceptor domain -containing protein [Novosphingobium sp. 9U]|uniref:histidine kinase dimerization/phosphoacceptor domain -containing protein n=1 Tax=Novosphingobium sp. 9U TaxID=2653158 RepID=UPI0012F1E74F|nr:histidine kinase dimerization/phosphoacceptor domain -containing protein [Novosphingobium sp. 9U]VWX53005.1 Histidine kinase [Novosphingobium sp. 9U]
MSRTATLIERLPLLQKQPVLRCVLAVVLSLATVQLRWSLKDWLPVGYPFVVFFPTVIVTAFVFGRMAGILAGFVCGLFAWYYFIPPVGVFSFDRGSLVAMAFYTGVIVVDIALIHWMQVTNRRLRAAREEGQLHAEQSDRLAERSELLFQELQHRVGNNLQMVAAVLSLQLRGLDEPRARRAISDAVARVQVIGSIQRRLYRSNGELVPLDDFIREVSEQIMRSSGGPGVTLRIEAATGLVLPPDAAVPMALILAEAIANALEHGLAGRAAGSVTVLLEQGDGSVRLEVRDNGAGLPPGFDAAQADSLGLRISRVLSRQLGADYALHDTAPGCRMCLSLPEARFAGGPLVA